ncbi:MAG TPA: DUF1552 domain-containing protein [Polyangia bacterium]|jgi:hypothetical protein|nr:DUF1552 domain-containing protein [Polyangia bacterium]
MKKIKRRGIIKGLAASALAAPLAQAFRMHTGRAATTGPVPKVVFFYTPCGVEPPMWHTTDTGATFTLPRLSAPLQPFASDCIFMDGISMVPLNDHQGGSQQMLAGDEKDVTTLDLQLGDFLKALTPISSLELGVQTRISKGGTPTVPHPHFTRISLAHEVFAEDNPLAAFSSVFGSGAPATMNNSADAMKAAMLLAKQRKSVLDIATADLNSLTSRLPNSEKNKIASYTDAVRTLEMRLTDPANMSNSAMCTDFSTFNPTHFMVPQVSDFTQSTYEQTAGQGTVADLQMEISRLALACGRTRVITLLYGHTNAHNPITGLGPFGVHDASHFNAPPGQLVGNATPAQVDAKLTAWRNYREWFAQRLAQFVTSMKATPDPDMPGTTLFDNTIIFHCSELGDGGPHKTDRIPFVFIGGRNLGFKLGQAINFTNGVPAYSGGLHSGLRYMSHSPLLTIIAQKMGMVKPGDQITRTTPSGPITGSLYGFTGPQALDPMSIGIV